jgi:hypothetical protein
MIDEYNPEPSMSGKLMKWASFFQAKTVVTATKRTIQAIFLTVLPFQLPFIGGAPDNIVFGTFMVLV